MLVKQPDSVVASFKHADVVVERERRMLHKVLKERRVTVMEIVRKMERNIDAVAALREARGLAPQAVILKGTRMNEVVISDMMIAAIHGVVEKRDDRLPCPHQVAEFDESWVAIIHEQLRAEGQTSIEEQQRIIRKRREDNELDDDPTEAPVILRSGKTQISAVQQSRASIASGTEPTPSAGHTMEPLHACPQVQQENSQLQVDANTKSENRTTSSSKQSHKKGRLRSVARRLRKAVHKPSTASQQEHGRKSAGDASHKRKNSGNANYFDENMATNANSVVGGTNGVSSASMMQTAMGKQSDRHGAMKPDKDATELTKKRRMKRSMFGSLYNFNRGNGAENKTTSSSHHNALRSESKMLYPKYARQDEHFEVDMAEVLKNDPNRSPTKRWSLGGKKNQRALEPRLSRSMGNTPNSSMRSLASSTSDGSSKGHASGETSSSLGGGQAGTSRDSLSTGGTPSSSIDQRDTVIGANQLQPPIIGAGGREEPHFEHYRFYFNSKIGSALGLGRSRSGKTKQKKGEQVTDSDNLSDEYDAAPSSKKRQQGSKISGRSSFRRFAFTSFKGGFGGGPTAGTNSRDRSTTNAMNRSQTTDQMSFKERSTKYSSSAMSLSFATVTTEEDESSMSVTPSGKSFKMMSTKSVVSQADSEYTIWEDEEEDQYQDDTFSDLAGTSSDDDQHGMEPPIPVLVPETNFDSVLAC